MAAEASPPEGGRIVLFSNLAGGAAYPTVAAVAEEPGQWSVGAVTSPGPEHHRSRVYLEAVAPSAAAGLERFIPGGQ